ncbi:hypothetical protein [Arthrobacter sp. 135MFCol5.1]|uniref:hypothetical protein n=1 Tax=Arthrobacter sp. 135MFCol5.1 TaxID=1158050 RepID=UPI00036E308E|nr:hypothetical protein [Arthrobacter sp. 135MFCol5.1]
MATLFRGPETVAGQSASEARAALRTRTEAIRNDKRLTSEAKQAAIAREYLQTKRQVQELYAAEKTAKAARRNELTKSLFGQEGFTSAQDAISYRDAQDRADSIPVNAEDRALTLLKRAELSGDTSLTKALLNRALEAGWVNVANAYIEANPYKGAQLEELWGLQDPDPASPAALQAQITESATFDVPKPDEISSYASDTVIEQVAASDA